MINTILLPLSSVILISLYTLSPSFNLGLFGDDWLEIWRYIHFLGPGSTGQYNHFSYFVGTYGAYDIIIGLLYNVFSSDYKIYYILAYLFRIIAAFSLIPLVFYHTKSKLAAFFAVLFFSITTIGVETTNWVFNMPSYLAIAFSNLFLYFFISSYGKRGFWLIATYSLFFYLAHIFAPIRMTGLLFFTTFLEVFLFLKTSKSRDWKLSLFRLSILFIIFILISLTGKIPDSGSIMEVATKILDSGFFAIFNLLKQGRSDFLFYPIMTVGRMIIPNTIVPHVLILFLGLTVFISVLVSNIPNGKKIIPAILGGTIIWTIITFLINSLNKSTLLPQDAISLAIGGYTLLLGVILLIFSWKQIISLPIFIGIFWTFFSYIFTWVRAPETLLPTDQRYLITPAVGITILLASIIGLGPKLKNRINLFLLLIPFVLINIITTRGFFIDVVENSHGKDVVWKIWSNFPHIPEVGKSDLPLVFYFQSPPDKQRLLYHSVSFGFPFHIAIIYNIYDSYYRMPIPMEGWKEVVSSVTDGNSLVSRCFPAKPIPITNVYGFYLDENYNLINTTDEIRGKLKEEMDKPASSRETILPPKVDC